MRTREEAGAPAGGGPFAGRPRAGDKLEDARRRPRGSLREGDLTTADVIWMDGEFVPWEDAKVHVLTHTLHYGTAVFEGIRAYETEDGTAVFRHRDHLERLRRSAELYYMELPHSLDQLREATHELITRNGFRSCHIRPLAYRGFGPMGVNPLGNPVEVAIAVWEWGAYLGEEGKTRGIRAKVSSWRRISSDVLIPQAKASGQYLNSVLAKIEATHAGYDEAILLDHTGNVSEGSGENLFLVRDGSIATPPLSGSILPGITRSAVIAIARDLGHEVVERDIARAELAAADEVFFTGTAAEVTPIREIDDREVGPPGEVTLAIQRRFDDAVHGREDRYRDWLDFVQVPSRA